jgi:hypothetical protein
MWLRSTFLSYPTTFLICKKTKLSRLLAMVEVVDKPKSLSSRCIVRRLPESSRSYMWLRSTFISYSFTFLTCKITVSYCLLATVKVVDRPKSYQVDVLCVDYSSNQIVTCGYKVLFSLIPLLSLLER